MMLLESTIIYADILEGEWKHISQLEFEKALSKKENVLLVDLWSKKQELLPTFILEGYVKPQTSYGYISIPANTDETWTIGDYETALLTKFHYSWINASKGYIFSSGFRSILSQIKTLRDKEKLYPESYQMLLPFLTPLDKIKGVWINPSVYDRADALPWAFSLSGKSIHPELEELNKIVPLDADMQDLRLRGCLLLNQSLTSQGKAIWSPFIDIVLEVISIHHPTIPILLFDESIELKDRFKTNPVLTASIKNNELSQVPHFLSVVP